MVQKLLPQSQSSRLERLWREAWTEAWGFFTIISGAFVTGFHYLGSVVTNSGVQSALEKISLPQWVGLLLAVIGAVTVISAEHPSRDS